MITQRESENIPQRNLTFIELVSTIQNINITQRLRLEAIGEYFGNEIRNLHPDQSAKVIISSFNSLPAGEFIELMNGFTLECNISIDIALFYSNSIEEWIDNILVQLANSSEIDTSKKVLIFDKLSKYSVNSYQTLVNTSIGSEPKLNDIEEIPLPITAYYVLSTNKVFENEKILRKLKRECRVLQKIVKSEYGMFNSELISETITPITSNIQSIQQLKNISLDIQVSYEDESIGVLQYLRIIREYINENLADNATNLAVAKEQNSDLPYSKSFRIGREYTDKHERFYRCYTFFLYQHAGNIAASTFVVQSKFNNISKIRLPIDPDLATFIENMGELEIHSSITNTVQAVRNERPDLVRKFARHSQKKVSVETTIEFLSRFLERLGLLSSPEFASIQINARNSRTNLPELPKTLTILVEEKRKLAAMNSTLGLILLPGKDEFSWNKIIANFALHEVTHFIQQVAFNNSLFPGSQYLNSLGRSAFLSESGSIKNQKVIDSLGANDTNLNVTDEDSIPDNRYHWTAVFTHIIGGSFTQVLSETRIAKRSKAKTIGTIMTVVSRLFSNFGPTGAIGGNHFQYPSDFGLLRYIYQKMPKYNGEAYFVSKIPSHRLNDLSWIFEGNYPSTKDLAITALEVFDEMER